MSQLRRRRSDTLVVGAVAALVLNASVSSATESVTTSIAGTESCPAGSVVRFYVTTTYSQLVSGYWPSSRTTANSTQYASNQASFQTTSQSTSWKVTGPSLQTADSYCSP
jgi:hypothetical protein